MADQTYRFSIEPQVRLDQASGQIAKLQQQLDKLSMPKTLGAELKKELGNLSDLMGKYKNQLKQGISNKADSKALDQTRKQVEQTYQGIINKIDELNGHDIILKADASALKDLEKEITGLKERIQTEFAEALKGDNTKLSGLSATTRSTQLKGMVGQAQTALEKGDLKAYEKALDNIKIKINDLADNSQKKLAKALTGTEFASGKDALDGIGRELEEMKKSANDAYNAVKPLQDEISGKEVTYGEELAKAFERGEQASQGLNSSLNKTKQNVDLVGDSVTNAQNDFEKLEKTTRTLENQVESYFGLNAIFRTVANLAREAMETVKTLDKAMTETAVVTNYSVSDMWEKLPIYTAEANKLGSTIEDVYRATTLYYQQGLNTTQSMGLAVETLKMARIAGMDAKDATNAMTAALRGFNLELNQVSAQRINDVYSELAAITASDTQEISTAMEKVASLAHNAGMELETTSAFLAQMIETTREAPENLGTALKTVIARFQEMKQDPTKLIDSEGVAMDANKVDKALKSIGVALTNERGEFRKLDDVFLEIAGKWDTLTMGQQRYIATMAAGSRQQSRFIAMMSNYSRTMELVDAAYDSSGASQRQFEKTLESMDSKLNQLKNAWDQFTMGLMNNELLKGAVDLGTDLLDIINKLINAVSELAGPGKGIAKSIITLTATVAGLNSASKLLHGVIQGGTQWAKGTNNKGLITNIFGEVFKKREKMKISTPDMDVVDDANLKQQAIEDAQIYKTTFSNAIKGSIGQAKQALRGRQSLASNQIENPIDAAYYKKLQKDAQQFEANGQIDLANDARKQAESMLPSLSKTQKAAFKTADGFNAAGTALQAFGNALANSNSKLAPFGKALSAVGSGMVQLSGVMMTSLNAAVKEGATGLAAFGTAVKFTLTTILPYVAIFAAIAAAGYLLYREFTREKREMEALANAAKTSSDAFDNLKTASEELKNSIEEIRNADSLFDGLVVGTTEWNLALVEANQQILDLIKKYPMLQDYLTTDANGRMGISEAGFKAVQDEQKKILGQAQSLEILTNSAYNTKLKEQDYDKLLKENGVRKPIARAKGEDVITEQEAFNMGYSGLSDEAKQEWDGIQAQIEAEAANARKQAVRAALASNGELNDTILSLFSQNLDTAAQSFEGETDMSVIKQAYADFIGGVFDSATGTITDLSGEEVSVDNDALKKMYPQIMALLQFQDQAPKVESAVKSLGSAFDSIFDEYGKGQTFIDDLLNNNVDIDLSALEKFEKMTDTKLINTLNQLGDERIQAIMQDEEADASKLAELLRSNAANLKQLQTNTYKDAAVWYAKIYNYSAKAAGNSSKILAKRMTEGMTSGSAAAFSNFMNQISTAFNYTSTVDMGRNLFSSLDKQSEDVQKEISDLINGVDWTSAIEHGQFYKQYKEGSTAFKKLNEQSQNFIKNQKKVDKSLDLTGKQFEELVQSSDFLEILANKWEDFANETGQLDTSGVEKMAEECGTLNDLLELGELDASTLATALNYFNETGSFDGITGAVLSAIDEFDSLDKLINQVKKDIDTFTPGENYEQGIEAFRGYANSLKENYENGKYSSADTLSYARALTNVKWKDYVKEHGKSNKSAEKELVDSLSPLFTENEKDTTLNILKRMEKGQTITGTKAGKTDTFTIGRGKEGQLQLHIDEKTTRKEFQQALQDAYGFSEEFARAFTLSLEGQDWGFIDDNITDGFNKAGRSEGISKFVQGIADRALLDVNKKGIATNQINGQQIGENNQLVISQSELEALKDLGGYEDLKEVRQALADELGISVEHIRSFNEETQNADNYLRKRFGKQGTQKSRAENFLNDFKDSDGVANFDKATAELEKSGISASKALDMAVEMAKTAGEEEVKWGNQLVPLKDVINGEGFNTAVDKLEDEAKWVTVGEKIGEAVANVLVEYGIGKKPEDKTDESQNSTKKTAGNRADSNKVDGQATEKVEKKQQREEKIQSNIEQRNGQKEETLIITPQVDYSEARGEYINYKKDVEKNPPETEVKGNTEPLKNNVDKEVNAIESNPAIKTIDADNQPAITKDGILVSTIQKTATKPMALNTQQADQTNRDAESRYSKPVSKTINLKTILSGLSSIPQKIRDWLNGSGASGINNYIPSSGFYTGSMARGNGKGVLGPKGKGGLTLTGEKGFEIAWLPSENRSMILGAHGPQMANLPADAVVWNHEQSKRIVTQKGISLGSMTTGNFDDPVVDVTAQNNEVKVTVSTDPKDKDKKKDTDKKTDKPHTNWLKIEIERYNLTQRINKITEKIEKNAKKIDDSLSKIGTTYKRISKNVDTEISLINDNIKYQQELQKSYNRGLRNLVNGSRSLWVSLQTKNKKGEWESQEELIDTSKYITREKDGTYSINRNKIANDYSLQPNREAIFNALQSEIDKLTNGANSAAQAIADARQKIKDVTDQVKETFFAWENELTKIYDLTQQIADADARRTRFASENGLLMAQIGAGYESAASAGRRLIQVQKQDTQLIKERVKLTQEDITVKREQLSRDVSSKDEKDIWQSIQQRNEKKKAQGKELTTKEIAQEEAAKDDYLAAKYTNKYVKRTRQADGSYKFDFNEEKLERDRRSGKINKETYDAIKEGFDTMVESNEAYQQSISDGFDYLAEIYKQYGEYVKTMADLESDLIDAYEKAAQKEVQKLESLNSSLTASFKKVIDQVKRNIDNRRRQEDNLKTEGDIAQKQQRLAMLRANTSGGNQVEAAQLEKEIGDAQTQYGRTLEDQMLANMQQQADQAAQQRQEQIDLAKQQIEYNKEAGIYAAQADKLLEDVKGNATQIQNVLDVTKDQTAGKWGDEVWKAEVQTKIADGITASAGITDLQTQLSDNSSAINTLAATLTGLNKKSTKPKKKTPKKNQPQKEEPQKEEPEKKEPQKEEPQKEEPQKEEPNLLKVTTSVKQQVAAALWRDAVGLGWGNGKTRHNRLTSVFGPKNANAIQAIVNKGSNKQVPYKKGYDYKTQKKKKYKKYLSGGLADSTGPAWLDGTTSKPELVLNAQDTKNFIALKDILSGVMHDISHISSSEVTNAPTEININVNVDKVTSDYDVDKLAKRLKNDIVKDMNYRNVTQVRNFR